MYYKDSVTYHFLTSKLSILLASNLLFSFLFKINYTFCMKIQNTFSSLKNSSWAEEEEGTSEFFI